MTPGSRGESLKAGAPPPLRKHSGTRAWVKKSAVLISSDRVGPLRISDTSPHTVPPSSLQPLWMQRPSRERPQDPGLGGRQRGAAPGRGAGLRPRRRVLRAARAGPPALSPGPGKPPWLGPPPGPPFAVWPELYQEHHVTISGAVEPLRGHCPHPLSSPRLCKRGSWTRAPTARDWQNQSSGVHHLGSAVFLPQPPSSRNTKSIGLQPWAPREQGGRW